MNGQIYGHQYSCDWEGKDFVFVHCGDNNLSDDYEYWGGVRFSVKEFEQVFVNNYRVFHMDRINFKDILLWLHFWCQTFSPIIFMVKNCLAPKMKPLYEAL